MSEKRDPERVVREGIAGGVEGGASHPDLSLERRGVRDAAQIRNGRQRRPAASPRCDAVITGQPHLPSTIADASGSV